MFDVLLAANIRSHAEPPTKLDPSQALRYYAETDITLRYYNLAENKSVIADFVKYQVGPSVLHSLRIEEPTEADRRFVEAVHFGAINPVDVHGNPRR